MKEFLKKINPYLWYRKIRDYNRLKKAYVELANHATFNYLHITPKTTKELCEIIDKCQQEFYYKAIKEELEPLVKSGNIRKIKQYVKSL